MRRIFTLKMWELKSIKIEEFKKPYELKGFTLAKMNFATKIGLNKVLWDKCLKENGALDKCLNRPFLEKRN